MSSRTIAKSPPHPDDLTPKGRATRERILRSAAEHIYDHGLAASTIDEIRKATSASPSQLSHYFGDRHDLVSAAIGQLTEMALDSQQPWLGRLDSFEAFERWCERIVASRVERDFVGGCPVGALVAQVSEVDETWRSAVAQSFADWGDTISRGIRSMQENGLLRSDASPDKLAAGALAAIEGGSVLAQVTRTAQPLVDALDMFMSLLRSYAR